MGYITLSTVLNGAIVPIGQLQFSLRLAPNVYTWQDSNVFENPYVGMNYWSVRRRSDGNIINSGSLNYVPTTATTYVGVFTGNQITINQATHNIQKIKNVMIKDKDGWVLNNNYKILSGVPPYDEAVVIEFDEIMTNFEVRIS